jgi:hypothetical protein
MGTFAETAIVDYRLSFADQGKQKSVFRLQQKRKFAVSDFHLQKRKRNCHFLLAEFQKRGETNGK